MDSQHQDMSFTGLLSGNSILSLADSPPLLPNSFDDSPPLLPNSLDDSPILLLNSSTNVRKSSRGVNFNIEEDILLVSAWLNCSLDAIQGTDRKNNQYWDEILDYFNKHKQTTTKRTGKSLSNRWSCIQKATNSFCSYLAQVEGLNQSGTTEQDKFEKAKTMFQSLQKSNFQFEHCWKLLKDQPKWISSLIKNAPKQKTATNTSPSATPNVIENEVIELDRPMGRKASKVKRKQERQSEEFIQLRKMKYTLLEESRAQEKEFYRLKAEKMEYDKAKEDERMRLEVEKLRIEAEKVELAKMESDQRIMMMDVNVLPEIQRQYFQELQREIMMRRNHE